MAMWVEPSLGWSLPLPACLRAETHTSRPATAANAASQSISKPREGRMIAHKLVEGADVLIQNFRKGVAERLEMDYETLKRINPKLIYASASGFGPEGPDSELPSLDGCGQARAGADDVRDTALGAASGLRKRRSLRPDRRHNALSRYNLRAVGARKRRASARK